MNSAFFAESCFEIAWLFRNCLINFNFSKKWVSRLPKITFLLMPCPSVKHLKLKKKTNLTFFLDFLSLKLSLWSDSKLWNGCDIHYLDLSPVSRLHARECNHVISRVVKHVLIAACSVLLLSGAFPSGVLQDQDHKLASPYTACDPWLNRVKEKQDTVYSQRHSK